MIKTIVSQNGQTMYDLCLMVYRSLDLIVKLCVDNGVDDTNYVPFIPQVFVYDTALTVDQKTTSYVYATSPSGQYLLNTAGPILFSTGGTPLSAT